MGLYASTVSPRKDRWAPGYVAPEEAQLNVHIWQRTSRGTFAAILISCVERGVLHVQIVAAKVQELQVLEKEHADLWTECQRWVRPSREPATILAPESIGRRRGRTEAYGFTDVPFFLTRLTD